MRIALYENETRALNVNTPHSCTLGISRIAIKLLIIKILYENVKFIRLRRIDHYMHTYIHCKLNISMCKLSLSFYNKKFAILWPIRHFKRCKLNKCYFDAVNSSYTWYNTLYYIVCTLYIIYICICIILTLSLFVWTCLSN